MTNSLPQRKSLRLHRYDYARSGMYFVPICTRDRVRLFGAIVDEAMRLNTLGSIVENCWRAMPTHHAQAGLDEFFAMPNHVHGIVVLGVGEKPGAINRAPTALGEIVRAVKAHCARQRANAILDKTNSSAVWQRNYHEHMIRNEQDLGCVREYINSNPARWAMDSDNPSFRSTIVDEIATPQV